MCVYVSTSLLHCVRVFVVFIMITLRLKATYVGKHLFGSGGGVHNGGGGMVAGG